MHYPIAVLVLLFAFLQIPSVHCEKKYRKSFINPYPRFKAYHDNGDPGEPLFLTPLIEAKKISEAQTKAKVVGAQFQRVKSFSGYLTVDKHYNSNLFFWYFPAEVEPETAPVVLWLQGGPGASSLFGLFTENGPFKFSGDKLGVREFRWNKNLNLIYIDNPVGTGFSFADNEAGYSRNEKEVGHNLYEAMKQIFLLFDFSKTKGFYITGESYGGKYVPALAYYTYRAQKPPQKEVIPLRGMAIGNGLSDPQNQMNYGDYLYQLGLIDSNGRRKFEIEEKKGIDCIHKRDMDCAFDVFDSLINMDETSYGSLFRNLTGYEQYFNYLKTKPDDGDAVMGEFLQSALTRRAIHVGNKTFHDLEGENKVEKYLKKDVMDSVAPWVAELLDNGLKVCIYNGQLDIIVAYPLTMNYVQKLKFNSAEIYKNASREIWWVDGEVAGYKKQAGNLTEMLVRNAGHMAPMDQPKWMFDLISNFTGTNSKK
ncbi:venom serine carboxypeptidase-like [Eupeodes corollae]|uniref:venom serine carboxypeptidase-like n=1 Tax=Eupeodes corollae TaxID=290404 RepID=UPI002493A2E0|nr:venom serine carboxypeptidase-like [Eupeodes corollae]XP_055918951.1 venom serine carboxypeptidase-like [Eupeodes corollae]